MRRGETHLSKQDNKLNLIKEKADTVNYLYI